MEQLIEFAGKNALLSGGFVVVFLILIWTEFTRRTQGFVELAPTQAIPMINANDTVVIDVSAAADFHKGHIVGARNILPSRIASPDAEVEKLSGCNILVVCKNGQVSATAASTLVKLGAAKVAVLKGGMSQWIADNYPVTKD
ncbi:MAG: rhodanese-related sulfurtransferase [Lysobacterales bacterium]|jgi:rhodanese-related sulfurtransferase